MAEIQRAVLVMPPGFRSREAASFVAQWNDLSTCLQEDTRGLEPAELEWQAAPGQNTIGMLLAHIAVVEVLWTQVGPLAETDFHFDDVLGIGRDDDGIPLPEGGTPPAALSGRDLAWYDMLLAKAREYSTAAARKLEDHDLDVIRHRKRRDGREEENEVRWILYHLTEHFAGHYYQVNLLRHQYRACLARR